MDIKSIKRFKNSGWYKRKVKKKFNLIISEIKSSPTSSLQITSQLDTGKSASGSVENKTSEQVSNRSRELVEFQSECVEYDSEELSSSEYENEESKKDNLRDNIKHWAVKFNISHVAINELSKIVNVALPYSLPLDARTLLKTNKEDLNIIEMEAGSYWHNGLITELQKTLKSVNNLPNRISLNINIDGLPIYKSSNIQLWPILCSINEMKDLPPLVLGIYHGKTKPSNLIFYLSPFVNEMLELEKGLTVTNMTGMTVTIAVGIRAFVCDSPARALIKGVANFNHKHGCQKCTIVGEYSHVSHTVTFPKIDCAKRNDQDFRDKKYGQHHKCDSPLLKLKIDMIEDFPVSDSLHLIDLGIMKRLLVGWRDGNFIKRVTKWCSQDIEKVNRFLSTVRLPKEIHRAVRQLDVLAHWKGSEYRTFLLYLGLIILKYVMKTDAYNHYMCFFCAITICSNKSYFNFLRLAQALLNSFILHYDVFYGKENITSNMHNLSHLVDEVKKFGILQSFNAYPFENKLQTIKKLLRQGNNPLSQVARRLQERRQIEVGINQNKLIYPFVISNRIKNCKHNVLHLEHFLISPDCYDKWFLTNDGYVIETISIRDTEVEGIRLTGYILNNLLDAFDYPIKSSLINIYKCLNYNITRRPSSIKEFTIANIKCKLVSVIYNSEMYFIPLVHTL